MMTYLAAAAIAGAYLAQRNAPKTKLQKMQILGPRTGMVYVVDLVPNLGIVIIHAPDGSHAVFQKNQPPKPGFTFVRGVGSGEVVNGMKQDLEA
jgi:hypothetical protein